MEESPSGWQESLQGFLHGLADLPQEQRVVHRGKLIADLQSVTDEQADLRREELQSLRSEGWDRHQLKDLLGVTLTRIGQLLSEPPKPGRSLLGTAALTVALGGKWEAGPKPPPAVPYAVVSVDALSAYQELTRLAAYYGLSTTHEVIPPPGLINLNRRNLIVVGSPRILPPMMNALRADPYLGFDFDAEGRWYLTEGDRKWRSPSDSGEAADYAYIGRLKRIPDGRTDFLYLAGIHGAGTRGAARYLAENIGEIFEKVGRNRWSVLVRCDYDQETREIKSTAAITEVRTFKGDFRPEGE